MGAAAAGGLRAGEEVGVSPPWMRQAACKGAAAELFFPEEVGGASSNLASEAKRVCWTQCPVREECLEHAIVNRERHGVWGGLAPRERARLSKERRVEQLRAAYPPFKRCVVCRLVQPKNKYNEAEPGRLRGDCKDCQQAYRKAYDERRKWQAS